MLSGQSAGGNLAAAVALKLRDDEFQPAVKMQVLIYPVVQGLDFRLPSMIQNDGLILERAGMAEAVGFYLEGNNNNKEAYLNNDHVSPAVKKMKVPYIDVTHLSSKYLVNYEKPSAETGNETMWNELKDKLLNPYFSPLVADRLDGLPLSYIFTAEYDVLRDEGFLYAHRLRNAGIKVEHDHSEIGIHAMLLFHESLPEADVVFQKLIKFMVASLYVWKP